VGVAVDVTTDEGAARLLREVPQVDILVNNLGIFGALPALEITDEQWRTYSTSMFLRRCGLSACIFLA
jgi:NAD(P)-dependent dehydrogenase (short-subunit alcohol dehydrogenase family)